MRLRAHALAPKQRLATAVIAATLAAVLSGCSPRHAAWLDLPLPTLSNDFEPLRTRFNKDAGKVRVLMLLDPT
ncbi:MAG TPA: hypothetical protein VG204_05535 [Terriglobia bacterium]|nr:hypothetical protein [Terriglobia bacterium]